MFAVVCGGDTFVSTWCWWVLVVVCVVLAMVSTVIYVKNIKKCIALCRDRSNVICVAWLLGLSIEREG